MCGVAAVAQWKCMSETEQNRWRDLYIAWCLSHGHVSTPSKKKSSEPAPSPVSTMKSGRAPVPQPVAESEPRFTTRAQTTEEFEKRWQFLSESLQESTSSSDFLKRAQDFHLLYLDVCHLLSLGTWTGSAAKAERALKPWKVNRNKLSRVQEWLADLYLACLLLFFGCLTAYTWETFLCSFPNIFFCLPTPSFSHLSPVPLSLPRPPAIAGLLVLATCDISSYLRSDDEDPNYVPARFAAGKYGTGMLTIPQRKDLVTHVTLCSLSNCPLSVKEIKQSMYRFYLLNANIIKAEEPTDWATFDAHEKNMNHIYRGWMDWVKQSYPKDCEVPKKASNCFI